MTVLLRRFHASALVALVVSMLVFLCGTRLFAQSSTLRLTTTATVQPRWAALASHKIYLLTTTATQAFERNAQSGKNVMGILAATNKGLYQSLDTGQTWGSLGLPNDDVYDAVIIGGSIIAATDKGIQTRAASVGSAWQQRTYPVSNQGSGSGSTQATVQQRGLPTYSLQTAGGNLFAATTRGVYRSNDGGATWTQTELSTTGTLTGKTVRTLALLGNTLFAAVWNDGIYRSTDNGVTWTFTDIVPGSTVEKTFRTLSIYGATAYTGSSEGNLYQSQNGTTWTKVVSAGNNGQAGVNARGVEALARYGSTIVGAVYNGIAVSHNNGQTWLLMPIATQDVNTIIILPPKPVVRSSGQTTTALAAHGKSAASLQLSDCSGPGNDVGGCGGGGGSVVVGSGGGGVYAYNIPGCNPMGIVTLTPNHAPQQTNSVSINYSVDLIATITDFQIQIGVGTYPSTWTDLNPTWQANSTSVSGTTAIPANVMNTPGTYSLRCLSVREDGTCVGVFSSVLRSFIVDPAVPQLTDINPITALAGTNITLTANGNNFGTIGELLVDGAVPLELTSYTTRINTQVAATFPTPPARITPYNVSVRVGTQTTGTKPLTVYNPLITLGTPTTSQTPAIAGQAFTVTLTGSGFLAGVTQISVNGTTISGASIGSGTITFPFTGSGHVHRHCPKYAHRIRNQHWNRQLYYPYPTIGTHYQRSQHNRS
jgi:hypothetical protein